MKNRTKLGYASAGKIEKKRFNEHKTGADIPTSDAKLTKWMEMREAQIRKKRNW